jgi:hypothetical membrane protein
MIGPRRRAAGAAALVAAAQYLVAEALAASAWAPPGYSYSRNYISDLGRTVCSGPHACSPWAVVMNTGFVVAGVLVLLAAGLLAPLIRPAGLRRLVIALACLHALGSMLVGVAHGGAPHATGLPSLHVLGAYAAIVGGNAALIAVAFAFRSRPARLTTLAQGIFGLGCGVALLRIHTAAPGLLERGAVDTATLWEVVTGLVLTFRHPAPLATSPAHLAHDATARV